MSIFSLFLTVYRCLFRAKIRTWFNLPKLAYYVRSLGWSAAFDLRMAEARFATDTIV